MANIVWPSELCPITFSLKLNADLRINQSPFGGSETVTDMGDDTWSVVMEVDSRSGVQAGKLEGYVNYLQGGEHTVELSHFARPKPNGTLQVSTGLTSAAAKGASTINIGGVSGKTLLAGDMLGVDGLLLQVSEDCVANLSGILTVKLVNRLRRSLPVNLPVNLQSPTAKFRMSESSALSHSVGYTDAISMKFEEDI